LSFLRPVYKTANEFDKTDFLYTFFHCLFLLIFDELRLRSILRTIGRYVRLLVPRLGKGNELSLSECAKASVPGIVEPHYRKTDGSTSAHLAIGPSWIARDPIILLAAFPRVTTAGRSCRPPVRPLAMPSLLTITLPVTT